MIGFHGQTVLHAPERRLTVQIGDGPRSPRPGIDVVYDLRAADVAAGGQGAPLAPVYHRALAAKLPERPVVVLNIGGVANVTWIGRDGELLAFDTGPGQCDDRRLDAAPSRRVARRGRRTGGRGHVHDDYVMQYLRHSYFGEPAAEIARSQRLPAGACRRPLAGRRRCHADGLHGRQHRPRARALPRAAASFGSISGGGRRNRTLMAMIAAHVETAVAPAEAAGMDGDAWRPRPGLIWPYARSRGCPSLFPAPRACRGPSQAVCSRTRNSCSTRLRRLVCDPAQEIGRAAGDGQHHQRRVAVGVELARFGDRPRRRVARAS